MQTDVRSNFTGPNVVLDRIRPAQNERRFYALSVTTDLFGNILLLRNWGRIGTGGRIRFDLYSGTPEAMNALENLAHAKQRRGYEHREVRHVESSSLCGTDRVVSSHLCQVNSAFLLNRR